ncbi:DUF1799 domain-containing protein [Rhizobium ruizarguesonis]|uniref:DUF1799 domain-containing protein n=1 Tax=Rhizobium ruizarguesonis TaxID=2081791 RepID=UPI0010314272|nr:DUF1799 domain-containing protein [Rhizobium ruizarguesonis]TBB53396.1 hypothetical protein ELH44_06815 [Rhizobium ruizarguesonis]
MSIASANWASLMAFLACETQWRVAGSLAGFMWIGLDWAGCSARLAHRETSEEIFDDIGVMENAALTVLNSEAD